MHISTDIPRLAAECGVKEAEIPKILSLFHELGLLIHLTKTQKLAKIVVTRPQWLIDMLTLVLRDGELHKKECIEKVAVITAASSFLQDDLIASMEEMLINHEEVLKYLRFWLYSLKMHAEQAPLFLIGTFLDKVQSKDLNVINAHLVSLIGDKFPQIVVNEDLLFLPVSNKTNLEVPEFRSYLIDTALQ